MSQTTSIIYGYGFKIANFDKNLINFNDFKKFLLKNKKYLNSNELNILNCINQYNSYSECYNDVGLGCAIDNIQAKNIGDNNYLETLITNVLCQKYQLPIGYFGGAENKNGYILYVPDFPWYMKKREKELDTVEKLEEIMLKMVKELNLKEILENENLPLSDYENVEYWG